MLLSWSRHHTVSVKQKRSIILQTHGYHLATGIPCAYHVGQTGLSYGGDMLQLMKKSITVMHNGRMLLADE